MLVVCHVLAGQRPSDVEGTHTACAIPFIPKYSLLRRAQTQLMLAGGPCVPILIESELELGVPVDHAPRPDLRTTHPPGL